MKKVVLITGTSSGIGLYTAYLFYKQGFQVVATMRNPKNRHTKLHEISKIDIRHLDVCDFEGVKKIVEEVIKDYGHIDVLINNAGYELVGALENMTLEQIHRQIDTNLIGMINLTKCVLPHMRKMKQGVILNVSSIGGFVTIPMMSLYHTSKFAVEGFSETLSYEVAPYGIKVKLIEPGPIQTKFYTTSMDTTQDNLEVENPYRKWENKVRSYSKMFAKQAPKPSVVAKRIYEATTDGKNKLRYPAGKFARTAILIKRICPRGYVRLVHFISSKL